MTIPAAGKLLVPPPSAVVWVPPAISGRRDLLVSRPLVTVIAGPGWGKTTVLRHVLGGSSTRWYRLDEADRDAATLAAGLQAAAWAAPDGTETQSHEPDPGATAAEARDVATLALEVEQTLGAAPGTTLVIDDAQLVIDSPGHELLRRLTARPAAHVRLVISSRRDLGLIDDRTRGLGRCAEFDARDLSLDLEMVAGALRDELDVDRALAARITDATGGWPVAVRLAIDGLRDTDADRRSATLEHLLGPSGPIGRYLRRVVAPAEAPAIHDLLARLHVLGGATPHRLGRISDRERAPLHDDLEGLLRRGLARARFEDPEVIELTPAVQRLVDTHILPGLEPEAGIVDTVVATLIEEGELAAGLSLLTRSERSEAAARLLESHGRALLHGGHLRAVSETVAQLPRELHTPAIESLRAEALAFRGEWAEALRSLDAAGLRDDQPLTTEQATQLGLIHHTRGDLDAAIDAYRRAPEDADCAERAALLGWRATAHWLRGELDDARWCAEEAMAAATRHADDRGLAYAHTALALVAASDGDRRANLAHYRQALTAASRAGDELQQARILTNLGSHHLEEGRYDDALEVTGQAIDLAEVQGFATLIGVARCNRSEALLATGALDEAIADAERAREVFARMGSRTEAYSHHLLAAARTERGEPALARQAYEQSIRLGAPSGDRQALVPAQLGLAWLSTGDDPDGAREAIAAARDLDDGMAAAEVAVADAWVQLSLGDTAAAAALAREGREVAADQGRRSVAALATTCLALAGKDPVPGLQDALAQWRELGATVWAARVELGLARRSGGTVERARVGELERTLTRLGSPLDRSVWAVRMLTGSEDDAVTSLRALGGFTVFQDGSSLPASSWGSRKARELVKVLIARAPRAVTREELGHLLWPDQPYDKVSGRLSTALSLARNALSGQGGDRDSAPIVAVGSSVRLATDDIEVDALTFRDLADAGLRAVREEDTDTAVSLLLDAEALYGGDLFEDEPDLPWAEDRRSELRSLYLSVARTLAKLVSDEDPELTIQLLLRVLDRDGYDEPAHLNLAIALLRTGRHGEARRRYRLYQDRMQELELPAVPFRELTRAAEPAAHRAAS